MSWNILFSPFQRFEDAAKDPEALVKSISHNWASLGYCIMGAALLSHLSKLGSNLHPPFKTSPRRPEIPSQPTFLPAAEPCKPQNNQRSSLVVAVSSANVVELNATRSDPYARAAYFVKRPAPETSAMTCGKSSGLGSPMSESPRLPVPSRMPLSGIGTIVLV